MSILDRITTGLQAKPSFSLQEAIRVSDDAQRLVVVCHSRHSPDDFIEAVEASLESKVEFVPGTIRQEVDPDRTIFSGIVVSHLTSEPYNDDVVKSRGLEVLSANVFKDGNDNVWKLAGEGDAKRLVQVNAEKVADIVKAKLDRNVVTAKYATGYDTLFGDYVAFYNPATRKVDFGYALGDNRVLSRFCEDAVEVKREQVVEVIACDSLLTSGDDLEFDHISAVDRTRVEASNLDQAFLQYWKALYSSQPNYYKALESLVNQYSLN